MTGFGEPKEPGETTARWREVLAAFDRVIALPEPEREDELLRIRAQSLEIHSRVLALLEADTAPLHAQRTAAAATKKRRLRFIPDSFS